MDKLRARLEQLVQGIDLARDRGRREVVHALERDVDVQLPSPVSVFGTLNATRGFIDFIRSSKLSMSIVEELAFVDGRQRLLRVAGEVGHDAHDERHLDFLLRAVQLDVVLDLHARRAIAGDEFLTAWLWPR